MPKLIHMMIRVFDLDKSVEFYRQAFSLTESNRLEFSDFSLVYLRNEENDMEVELTWNKSQTEPYDLGNGYGHVAFAVDDLDSTHQQFIDKGLSPNDIVEFAPDGDMIARFFFCQDPDGYKIEVLQRHGHYQ